MSVKEEHSDFIKMMEQYRSVQHLKDMYVRRSEVLKDSAIFIEFHDRAMELFDRVVPVLFEDPRIIVAPLPAGLFYDHLNDEMTPYVVRSLRHQVLWFENRSYEWNMDTITQGMTHFYQSMFLPDYNPPGCITNVAAIYELMIPMEVAAQDPNEPRRIGFMTRYAKRRFIKKDVPPFNYDEGAE